MDGQSEKLFLDYHANIHADLRALVREQARIGTGDQELERLCSMLVRAYDPCISCSVH